MGRWERETEPKHVSERAHNLSHQQFHLYEDRAGRVSNTMTQLRTDVAMVFLIHILLGIIGKVQG
jgi:hypothetical protein